MDCKFCHYHRLLKIGCEKIKNTEFRLRLGSSNPTKIKEFMKLPQTLGQLLALGPRPRWGLVDLPIR